MLKIQCFLQAMQILKRPTSAPAAPSGQSAQLPGGFAAALSTIKGRFMQLRPWKSALSGRGSLLFLSLFLLATTVGLTTVDRKHGFSQHDKAYYASPQSLSFARPGLVVKVQSASIAADGTITAKVLFTDPQGVPLDKNGLGSPGKISNGSPGVIAAVFQKDKGQFNSYTTRVQTSPITKVSAIQAGTDTGGKWSTQASDGSFSYTFGIKAPSGFDKTALHAVGVYGSRDMTEFNLGIQMADDVYYFTPADGSIGVDPVDEIKTASCQKCHGPNMAFHGTTGRSSLKMCNLCHTQQSTDPDTGNTVDLRVMVHKIHMGKNLPSVIAGTPYQIIGFGQSVNDWSTVGFPAPMMKCETCHEQNTKALNAQAYLTKPGGAACTACHDDVNLATGVNHAGGPQVSDNQCSNCHQASTGADFDASVAGAHVVPQESQLLGGIQWAITDMANATPGQKPTMTFTLADKNGSPLAPSDFARIAATIAGPTTDYTSFATGYVQEDISKATGSNGSYMYTFTNALPISAAGTFAVGLEGRRLETVLAGTTKSRAIQYGATNPVMYFSVDGSAMQARRAPTESANCQTCHYRLTLHGENRINNTAYCVFCHNPVESDSARRPANAGAGQTIDFKFLIHRIHGGETLNAAYGTDYTVFGFGGSVNSFKDVRYPSALSDCFKCHVKGSENPSEDSLNLSSVKTPRYPLNPTPGVTTACYGCHDSRTMLSHAQTQTSVLGESCSTCHRATADFSATKVHAAVNTVDPGQGVK